MFSVPTVKTALVAVLRNRPALAAVAIEHGLPTKVPTKPERIYVAGAKGVRRDPPPGVREEVFKVTVIVEVLGVRGAPSETTEARMWEIANEVEAELARDPELGVACANAWLELEQEHTAPTADKGFLSRGLFALNVTNHVR